MSDNTIYFTQFLFPNGRPKEAEISGLPAEVVVMADELRKAYRSFELECFPNTQIVHADCCDDDGPIAYEMGPNGPGVPAMIEKLVRSAHGEWVERGRPEAKGRRLETVQRRIEREQYE